MFNPYQPYQYQYGQTPFVGSVQPQSAFSTQRQQVIRVNGKNGAEAYAIAPDSSVLLLDENAPIVWLKSTDGAGYATVKPYRIEPYEEQAAPDYSSLDARIKRLEDMINAESNVAGSSNRTKKQSSSAGGTD